MILDCDPDQKIPDNESHSHIYPNNNEEMTDAMMKFMIQSLEFCFTTENIKPKKKIRRKNVVQNSRIK